MPAFYISIHYSLILTLYIGFNSWDPGSILNWDVTQDIFLNPGISGFDYLSITNVYLIDFIDKYTGITYTFHENLFLMNLIFFL